MEQVTNFESEFKVEAKQHDAAYWKEVNRKCCDYESTIGAGAWAEADKLDETNDDD